VAVCQPLRLVQVGTGTDCSTSNCNWCTYKPWSIGVSCWQASLEPNASHRPYVIEIAHHSLGGDCHATSKL